MGRKRTSKKTKMLLSVDKDLLDRLKDLEVNRSLLFTEAAEKYLSELGEKSEKNKKM
jgi:post-segregation antitoxin (ccd killing protein)